MQSEEKIPEILGTVFFKIGGFLFSTFLIIKLRKGVGIPGRHLSWTALGSSMWQTSVWVSCRVLQLSQTPIWLQQWLVSYHFPPSFWLLPWASSSSPRRTILANPTQPCFLYREHDTFNFISYKNQCCSTW